MHLACSLARHSMALGSMWPKVPFTGNGAYVANVASTKLVVLDFWRLKLEIEHWSLSERSCCRSLFERSSGAALPFPLVHGAHQPPWLAPFHPAETRKGLCAAQCQNRSRACGSGGVSRDRPSLGRTLEHPVTIRNNHKNGGFSDAHKYS